MAEFGEVSGYLRQFFFHISRLVRTTAGR
jgi:hypothetical protein